MYSWVMKARCDLVFSLTALNTENASLTITFLLTTACAATHLMVPTTPPIAPLPWLVAE